MSKLTDLRINTALPRRRCELCNHSIHVQPSETYHCTRCGLISYGANADVVLTPTLDTLEIHDTIHGGSQSVVQYRWQPYNHSDHLHDALCAYQFVLLSKLNDLLPAAVSNIVIDYMIWYRSQTDFRVGDRVDALDVKNQWQDATVVSVQQTQRKLKVHFDTDGDCHKYDIWLNYDSNALAPHGSRVKHNTLRNIHTQCSDKVLSTASTSILNDNTSTAVTG